ncbi:hypothetical protein BC828DRAFT_379326 [Blastocladiella britannica]|nr:hypothetical protein BC828DRAFT_379326 [Blastocladiella britannica]
MSNKQSPTATPGGSAGATKDLWSILKDEGTAVRSTDAFESQAGSETSIVVLGAKSSGKSTIINRFLDKRETPNPTVGLDYTYGRRTRAATNAKDVAHIWELGSGSLMTRLLEVPISTGSVHTTSVIICVDLSQPADVVSTIEHFTSALGTRVEELLTGLEKRGSKRPKGLRTHAMKKYGADHPDKAVVKPIPMAWAIVGTKYDVFRDLPGDVRRVLTRYLRYMAHIHGAAFLMSSDRADEASSTRGKQLVSHFAFKTALPKTSDLTDPNKPMFDAPGADNLSDIYAGSTCKSLADIKSHMLMVLGKAGLLPNATAPGDNRSSSPSGFGVQPLQHKALSAKFAEPLIDRECSAFIQV